MEFPPRGKAATVIAIPELVYIEGKPQSRRDRQGAATLHEFCQGTVILELLLLSN